VFSLARNAPLILLTWAIFHGRQSGGKPAAEDEFRLKSHDSEI
jgi:hypothetical protein